VDEVESYYDSAASEEWGRLERHRTEFAVTLKAFAEHMPEPPGTVLDIGGGPGRYAVELAGRGHTVTLLDVSEQSLRIAETKAQEAGVSLTACIHASALDMGMLDSATFDVVLLMGPLYHLLSQGERVRAVREALRVLRPGGTLFAAFITRFAPFRYSASKDVSWFSERRDYALEILESGVHDQPEGFTRAYFAHPGEVIPLMQSCGAKTLALIGSEGILAGHENEVNALDGEAWQAWVELNYRLGQEPSLHGAADHLLYVGAKPSLGAVNES
jgi:ubiquinone/menaquinone biosynthesis C-methylase UbiE